MAKKYEDTTVTHLLYSRNRLRTHPDINCVRVALVRIATWGSAIWSGSGFSAHRSDCWICGHHTRKNVVIFPKVQILCDS